MNRTYSVNNPATRSRPRFARLAPATLWALGVVVILSVALLCAAPARAEEEKEMPRKLIKMTAENWKFVPDTIRVSLGTTVVLQIRSYDATHRFDLKAYGLKVLLPQEELTEFEFVADKAGVFKWKCGRPCGDGCPKMKGKLTVVDPATAYPEGG